MILHEILSWGFIKENFIIVHWPRKRLWKTKIFSTYGPLASSFILHCGAKENLMGMPMSSVDFVYYIIVVLLKWNFFLNIITIIFLPLHIII